MSYSDELAYQADLAQQLTTAAPDHPCTCGPRGMPDVRFWVSEDVAEVVNEHRSEKPWPVGRPSPACPSCGGELKLIQIVFDEPTLPMYGAPETL